MADIAALVALAESWGVPLIEDAACALGAQKDGRPAGSWGALGCFSFHPRKAVTTGEGGAITTRNAELAWRLRVLRNHGLDPDAASPNFVAAGYNLRLTEFQAALGVSQMSRLDAIIEGRRTLAQRYTSLLAESGVVAPREAPGTRHVYQTYAVLLPPEVAPRRDRVIAALRDRGIETAIATHHMPLTTYFQQRGRYRVGDFPVTDEVAGRALALPLHTQLTQEDQERVVRELLALL
jgi:dTDP-4-amino-4,6-dideoxygalactose transaminase